MKHGSISLALLLSACASAPPRPPVTPPAPVTYALFVHVCDGVPCEPGNEPHKQPDAEITITRDGTTYVQHADGAGNLIVHDLVAAQRRVCAAADGFREACVDVTLPRSDGQDVFLLLERDVPPARTGLVRAFRHAVGDDGGMFNALGVTLMYAPWAYKFDRARLDANLAAAQRVGADYVRVLGSVGPEGWTDRVIDPAWSDYDAVIAGLTDLAYDRYHLRVQWSIFGGGSVTPADRDAVVDRFARMTRGRAHKVFAFEIANEGQAFNDDQNAMRALARRLTSQVQNLVAITAVTDTNACATYAGSSATAATMHYDRSFGGDDVQGPDGTIYHVRPIRQPWGWPGEYESTCGGQLPRLVFSNEPIGPQSSVNTDDQPLDIVMAYYTAFVAQNGAYVFHAGPGIRGGGKEDRDRGRSANLEDLPSFDRYASGLTAARACLPPGLANWTRHNAGWSTAPFDGFAQAAEAGAVVRVYAATAGPETFAVVLGLRRSVTASPKQAMALDVLDPMTCGVLRHLELGAGESFTLDADHVGLLLRGMGR